MNRRSVKKHQLTIAPGIIFTLAFILYTSAACAEGMLDPPTVLESIFFKSATQMDEIGEKSVQLAIVTPPYVNPRSEQALRDDEELLLSVFEQLKSKMKPNGVVAVAQTDLANGNGYYWRHDTVISAGRRFGFQQFDHKFEIRSLRVNLYRRMIRNIIIFKLAGGKVAAKNNADYNPTGWLLTKNQTLDGFRDAVSPNLAKILIERFSEPGDFILNPFSGSGTIIAVAQLLGRNARGYEMNPSLAPLILKRAEKIESFLQQPGEATAHVLITESRGLSTKDEKTEFALKVIQEALRVMPDSRTRAEMRRLCSKHLKSSE